MPKIIKIIYLKMKRSHSGSFPFFNLPLQSNPVQTPPENKDEDECWKKNQSYGFVAFICSFAKCHRCTRLLIAEHQNLSFCLGKQLLFKK
jgi:hypothetical protein